MQRLKIKLQIVIFLEFWVFFTVSSFVGNLVFRFQNYQSILISWFLSYSQLFLPSYVHQNCFRYFIFLFQLTIELNWFFKWFSCIFLGSFKLHLLTMASNNFRGGPILMIIASSCSIGKHTSLYIKMLSLFVWS